LRGNRGRVRAGRYFSTEGGNEAVLANGAATIGKAPYCYSFLLPFSPPNPKKKSSITKKILLTIFRGKALCFLSEAVTNVFGAV
jgi:hypothetical protein